MTFVKKLLGNSDIEITETDLIVTPAQPDTRTTLDKYLETSSLMLDRMNSRRQLLEADIARANEELRQVLIVIEGASAMAGVLQEGRK